MKKQRAFFAESATSAHLFKCIFIKTLTQLSNVRCSKSIRPWQKDFNEILYILLFFQYFIKIWSN